MSNKTKMKRRVNLAVMGKRIEEQQMEELTRAHKERIKAAKIEPGHPGFPAAASCCATFCEVNQDSDGEWDFFMA